jgi:hypothetical protein
MTIQVSSYYANGAGEYRLTLVQSPGVVSISSGDEGGILQNGARHRGQIAVGDLDPWTFTGAAGDSLVLRAGGDNFTPWIRVYGPDGSLQVQSTSSSVNNRDSEVAFVATNAGPFTVILSSYYLNGTGAYELTLGQSPGTLSVTSGDDGGPLTNGWKHTGQISIGDLDLWSFPAEAGDSVVVRAGGTGFTPYVRIYGPSGSLQALNTSSSVNNRDSEVAFVATNALITGIGGPADARVVVAKSLELQLPVASWSPVSTNRFNVFGVFDYAEEYRDTWTNAFYLFWVEP